MNLCTVAPEPPPPPPVRSAAGAQLLPLYFNTCPDEAPAVETSVKSFKADAQPPPELFVQLRLPEPSVLKTCPLVPVSSGNVKV